MTKSIEKPHIQLAFKGSNPCHVSIIR